MTDAARADNANEPRDGAGPQSGPATVTPLPRPQHAVRRRLTRWLLRTAIRLFLMIVVPITAILYGANYWAESRRFVTTENAYVKANVVAVSPDVSGRVIEVNVKDNQFVERNQVLFRIDPRPFDIEVRGALAALDGVKTEVESMRAAYRSGLIAITEAEQRQQYLANEFRRANELASRGVATSAQLDAARHDLAMADSAIRENRERNQMILADLNGNPEIRANEHPRYQALLAGLDKAQLDRERAEVLAPRDGIVSNVSLRLGEYVKSGTAVFSLIESDEPWIEANLKETQLTHVRVGQSANLVIDAYPNRTFEAVIDSISPATGAEFALLPPQNASGNWVKVVQRIPVHMKIVPAADQPTLRAGMTVSVEIDTRRETSLHTVLRESIAGTFLEGWVPIGLIQRLNPFASQPSAARVAG